MQTFRDTFKIAELGIRPTLEEYGFTLNDISITDENDGQWVLGVAKYIESGRWNSPFQKKCFIELSVAPLRLELDLEFGIGERRFTIRELHELEGTTVYPERTHDFYKAMNDEGQLTSEFERLIEILIECGSRFRSNEQSFWRELDAQRSRRLQNRENKRLFADADVSFEKQDWVSVVKLLEGKDQYLSKLDAGRLIYAKKKLKIT